MQVKGMEMPAYDPRGATALALAYAVSDGGPCNPWSRTELEEVNGLWDPYGYEGKAALVAAGRNRRLVIDSLGICEHAGLLPVFSSLYASATGVPVRPIYNEVYETLLEDFVINDQGQGVGVTGSTLIRAFNVRRGFGREDDVLPQRFFDEPLRTLGDDVHGLDPASFDRMLDEYYGISGWGRDGVPTRQTLERVGLDEAIADLY
jgi:aldehyde:ferredoxin oxidoreductase